MNKKNPSTLIPKEEEEGERQILNVSRPLHKLEKVLGKEANPLHLPPDNLAECWRFNGRGIFWLLNKYSKWFWSFVLANMWSV